MKDFSQPYRRVTHFGLWAEEEADALGHRDAWNILTDACRRCTTEDMRGKQTVIDALAWFENNLVRPRPVQDFRKSLDITDPAQRYFAVCDALRRIRSGVSA